MAGNLQMNTYGVVWNSTLRIRQWTEVDPNALIIDYTGGGEGSLVCNYVTIHGQLILNSMAPTSLSGLWQTAGWSNQGKWSFQWWDGAAWQNVFDVGYDGATGAITVFRGGDIAMLTDKMIQLSNETQAPTCNAANRGKIRFVQGAAGVADIEYRCMKSAADTYSWIQVAIG